MYPTAALTITHTVCVDTASVQAVSVPVSMASTRTLLGEPKSCDPSIADCCKDKPYTYCNPATHKCEKAPACSPEECKKAHKVCDPKTNMCVKPECDEHNPCPGKKTCDLTKYQCVKPAKDDKPDAKRAEQACYNTINNKSSASNVIGDITTGGR